MVLLSTLRTAGLEQAGQYDAMIYSYDVLSGETALFIAAKNGNAEVVATLLKCNADPTLRSHEFQSPLAIACQVGVSPQLSTERHPQFGRIEVVKALLRPDPTRGSQVMTCKVWYLVYPCMLSLCTVLR